MAAIRDSIAVDVFHTRNVFDGGRYRGGDRDGRDSAHDPGQRRPRCRGGLLTLQRQSRTDTRDGSQPAEQLGDDVAAEVVRWTLCGV